MIDFKCPERNKHSVLVCTHCLEILERTSLNNVLAENNELKLKLLDVEKALDRIMDKPYWKNNL